MKYDTIKKSPAAYESDYESLSGTMINAQLANKPGKAVKHGRWRSSLASRKCRQHPLNEFR